MNSLSAKFNIILNKPFRFVRSYSEGLRLIIKDKQVNRLIKGLLYFLSSLPEPVRRDIAIRLEKLIFNLYRTERTGLTGDSSGEPVYSQFLPESTITLITAVYQFSELHFQQTLQSVQDQLYQNFDFYLLATPQVTPAVEQAVVTVFGQDARVRINSIDDLHSSLAQAVNSVIRESNGNFIGFLSSGDKLASNALFEVAKLIESSPDASIIYSDEDISSSDYLVKPVYKPGWSRDLFYSIDYLQNFLCYQKRDVEAVGGFNGVFEDDLKYNMVLKIIEKAESIHHIPQILYHKQVPKNGHAKGFNAHALVENRKKALEAHFNRLGVVREVRHGIFEGSFRIHRNHPSRLKVSIIIPTKDKIDLLQQCIDSIETKTTYPKYEIIIMDNGSTEPISHNYFASSSHKVVQYPHSFNYSKINNLGASKATGEVLLFLNNDTQVISPEWLESMLEHIQRQEVGVVGAKLLYPDGLIQHAGVVLGRNSLSGHIYRFIDYNSHGYCGMADVIRNYNAVTGACLMIRAELFKTVGGFDEKLRVTFNDIDLCLKVRELGLLVVYTPYALLYHYEGVSRWLYSDQEVVEISEILNGEKLSYNVSKAQSEEAQYFYSRWKHIVENDIYYNPNCNSGVTPYLIDRYANYYNVA